ncbi:YceI family protein [Palleronia sp.]|uniref:YceI family protein n=1 Tax=Palleronia sp. TaxID=1940284 RepID=UPI0035C83D3E
MTRFALPAFAAGLAALTATHVAAEPAPYTVDEAHSEILFSWSHGGFSTTRGLVFDLTGDLMFDEEEPANSSVQVSFPASAMNVTPGLFQHLMTDDFFGSEDSRVTFESTSIEVTGETEGKIIGDLTINGQTKEVTLDAELTERGENPMGQPTVGFEAETTILRSDYGLGAFAPFVSDEVAIKIALEARPADEGEASGN